MTTITFNGIIQQPTGPNAYGALGYDNGGLFGPLYQSLGGLPWTLSITGTDCNCSGGVWGHYNTGKPSPITDAILTIDGHSLDLGAFGIPHSEWLDHMDPTPTAPGGFTFVQVNTFIQHPAFPAQGSFGAQYSVAVERGDADGGRAYLLSADELYPTNLDLGIISVPGPDLGTGLPAALLAFGLLCLWLSRKMT